MNITSQKLKKEKQPTELWLRECVSGNDRAASSLRTLVVVSKSSSVSSPIEYNARFM